MDNTRPFKSVAVSKQDVTKFKQRLLNIEKSLCSIDKGIGISQSETTQGGNVYEAALDSGGTPTLTATIAAVDKIRGLSVMIDTATRVSIAVTLADASTFTHLLIGAGTWSTELKETQSPVTSVVVTELDGTATQAVINYISI